MSSFVAGRVVLKPEAVYRLKVTDRYAIHRLMLQLVESGEDELVAPEIRTRDPLGLQWVDRGERLEGKVIDFLTTRPIRMPSLPPDITLACRELPNHFLEHDFYQFQIVVNPIYMRMKHRVAITDEEEILSWFVSKLRHGGAACAQLQVDQRGRDVFWKDSHRVVYARARISGVLKVLNRPAFIDAFSKGIGKGRAFGFGFLQLKII